MTLFLFFFFQAEDGIRDSSVTGVQTCALPICVPSDVVKLKVGLKPAGSVFSERDRAVTDFLMLPGGDTLVAAVETPGNSNQVPIPGKLKMLRSKNLKVWIEMDADYRAVAQRAVLASADAHHIWVGTDP